MRVILSLIGISLFCAGTMPALAQAPQISVEYDDAQTIVGQPAIVRVKVLVPTFMPKPPVWPSFEAPQLTVRLPERSTSPTSEQINGESWSGIVRSYRLYPMQEGVITVPSQDMIVVYADPETNEPNTVTNKIPAIKVVAVIPEGARGLDPLILANNVSASQTIEANEPALAVGDAIARKIRVDIEGTSPLFIPPLLDLAVPEIVKPYLQDPKVVESLERGVLAGSRDEQATYIALSGGSVILPDVEVKWFNLETYKIETITLAGQSFEITAIEHETAIDAGIVKRVLAVGLILLLATWLIKRFVLPRLKLVLANLQGCYLSSRYFAYRQAKTAISNQDLSGFFNGIDLLTARGALAPSDGDDELENAVLSLTASLYDDHNHTGQEKTKLWSAASRALTWWRIGVWQLLHRNKRPDLPPLNPTE